MESSKKHFRYVCFGTLALALIFVAWELIVRTGVISSLALPLPSKVLVECTRQITSVEFLSNWLRTLRVWSISLGIGLLIGLMLGFASGASKPVALVLMPFLGYFRSIPPIALFPVAMIAIGPGDLPIGLVAALGAALYVFPGTAEASRQIANRFSNLAKILGADRTRFLVHFVAPGAAVQAIASSRVAATYAFAVCVAGEMIIGGRYGVGAAILDLSERYQLEQAYVYVLFTGIVGVLIDVIFSRVTHLRIISNQRMLESNREK